MSTTTHQGAVGAETMTAPFGEPAYDPASDIATKIMALPWASRGLTDPRSGVFDHDALGDRHGAIQTIADKVIRSLATPAPRTDGGMTAGEDHAWTFERTRTYLLAELERLRADLHTIGEDLTGEQGKAASWLDVATGRVANVSSVLASATPAQPAGAVPDGLREAFEAAELQECWVNGDTADVMTNPYGHCGNFDQIVARCATGDLWRKRAVAIAESLNFVRTLLAFHPAGQSAGSGAEILVATLAEFQRRNGYHKREIEELLTEFGELLLSKVRPAPDSTRTGQGEAEELREEVAYWRRDLAARLWSMTALYKAALDRGEGDRAADLANALRSALASYHDAKNGEWYERCELCGEFVRDGEPRAAWEDVSGHARCLSEDGNGHVDPHGDEDLARWVEEAQAALDAPRPEAARPAAPEAQGAERVRHVKRGTEYEVLGEAEAQISRGMRINFGAENEELYRHLHEGMKLTVYRGSDGKLWCRFTDEFRDGRFVPAPPASSGQGGR